MAKKSILKKGKGGKLNVSVQTPEITPQGKTKLVTGKSIEIVGNQYREVEKREREEKEIEE